MASQREFTNSRWIGAAIATVATVAVAFYLNFNGDTDQGSPYQEFDRGHTSGESATGDDSGSATSPNMPDASADGVAGEQSRLDLASVHGRHSSIFTVCGDSSAQLAASNDSELTNAGRNADKAQWDASAAMVRLCDEWQEEFSSYENANAMIEYLEQSKSRANALLEAAFSQGSWDQKKERELIAILEREPSEMSLAALIALLHLSHDFRNALGASVGASNGEYVEVGASDIALLYQCRLEGDCSGDSFSALSACMANSDYCGWSVSQAVYRQHSLNYADDLMHMVDGLVSSRR